MTAITNMYGPGYYRNSYNRETLERALTGERATLATYTGKDMSRVATLAHRIGQMEMEIWRRDDLVRQGGK